MHSLTFWPILLFGSQNVLSLHIPRTAKATPKPTAKPMIRVVPRDAPSASPPCNMSPTDNGVPYCFQAFSSLPATESAPSITVPNPITSSASSTASIACEQQNQDPDRGIDDQGCICSAGTLTTTLPILTSGVDPSSSCAYTALSASGSVNLSPTFGPPVTNTNICSICSPVANNGETCTSMPSCTAKIQSPSLILQFGTSAVPLGTLTAAPLSTTLASVVSSLCPSGGTTCNEDTTATISGINWVDDGVDQMDNGELLVHVPFASWPDSAFLPQLIDTTISSFVASAKGSNCQQVHWKVPDHAPGKRDLGNGTSIDQFGPEGSLLYERSPVGAAPQLQDGSATYCSTGGAVLAYYFANNWDPTKSKLPTATLVVEITFQVAPSLDDLLICDFLNDALEAIEVPVEPEAAGPLRLADSDISKSSGLFIFNKILRPTQC